MFLARLMEIGFDWEDLHQTTIREQRTIVEGMNKIEEIRNKKREKNTG